jgi:hypothetical protein
MKEILPFLLILACPVMMIFMMRGMHGGGHQNKTDTHEMDAAELRRLRDDIDTRLQALDERLQDVEETKEQHYNDAVRT